MSPAEVAAIEATVADSEPFGSPTYLSITVSAVYMQLLSVLAERFVAAARALDALGHLPEGHRAVVLHDSLLRRTVEDGVLGLVHGADTIDPSTLDEVLLATAENAAGQPSLLGRVTTCVPLGSRPLGRAHIWADGGPGTGLGRRFQEEVRKRLPGLRFVTPTEDQIRVLLTGERLAVRVAPRLATSALAHLSIAVVGEFEGGATPFSALTTPGLPGVMVLSPRALSSSVDVAETLLHESMHLKFLDIDYVHPLFAPGFRQASSPRVTPVWHEGEPGYVGWPIDRLLTSMHVYLALAVFFGTAAHRVEEDFHGADGCVQRAARCGTRAAWLLDAAQSHLGCLSAAGRDFVAFISTALTGWEAARARTGP